jgi:hypothetical protein
VRYPETITEDFGSVWSQSRIVHITVGLVQPAFSRWITTAHGSGLVSGYIITRASYNGSCGPRYLPSTAVSRAH